MRIGVVPTTWDTVAGERVKTRFRRLRASTAIVFGLLAAGGAFAQDAVPADEEITNGEAGGGAINLDQVTVQERIETAWGPVDGYVAGQSATGTKIDTPLILVPTALRVDFSLLIRTLGMAAAVAAAIFLSLSAQGFAQEQAAPPRVHR